MEASGVKTFDNKYTEPTKIWYQNDIFRSIILLNDWRDSCWSGLVYLILSYKKTNKIMISVDKFHSMLICYNSLGNDLFPLILTPHRPFKINTNNLFCSSVAAFNLA